MVVNLSNHSYDVYIGRGSSYGNPYKIGVDGTRSEVIELYRIWLRHKLNDPEFMELFLTLRGKILGCHCKPKACHGDVIEEELSRLGSPLNNFIG
ncbi:protein of unknown function DUF4326 [Vibrio phage 1.081.O._10N.286.52.C2]|nr:protein of unknown function DUF4326 [Vibrio phage 1.081.O._10N.286.52.C2]